MASSALFQLAKKKGVQFHFNSPVQRIIEHQNKVKGVVVNNENIYYDKIGIGGTISYSNEVFLSKINNHLITKNEGIQSILLHFILSRFGKFTRKIYGIISFFLEVTIIFLK